MTTQEGASYRQQVEIGKNIVKGVLAKLATDLNQERINKFSFEITHQDFDRNQVSIIDPDQGKVVTKVEESDLADSAATPGVRLKLETHLDTAVKAYCKM